MATRMLRRGLPRVVGGEPWPPAAETAVTDVAATAETVDAVAADVPAAAVPEPAVRPAAVAGEDDTVLSSAHAAPVPVANAGAGLRRGLPRTVGGEPWPPAVSDVAPPATSSSEVSADAVAPQVDIPAAAAPAAAAPATAAPAAKVDAAASDVVRRGLPRTLGGEPWPPAGTVPAPTQSQPAATPPVAAATAADARTESAAPVRAVADAPATAAAEPSAPAPVALLSADLDTPLPWTRTVWNGRSPRKVAPAAAFTRRRPSWPQAIAFLFGAAALGVLAGAAIAFVRALLSLPFMQDFLAAFPGEYEPAISVASGFAPWVGWQHFFNAFLMVLIIRSGLQVRTDKRPTAFWTPRNNAKGKISLTLWFHQALDILWLVNGVIFIVLLIVTGHWVRIVPTSWEVFPNALSAALQYISFDWPHENGWNNYNSLQQLAYFTTVFIAAPLAAITGFRMSGLWPKKAERLSKAYPVEWARALHFPIMLYFVAFIIAHVALVMLTGFLRNLNHMYASQDAVTWTGFWVFVVSLLVIAGGWFAARPLVIAPIAKAFGNVSSR